MKTEYKILASVGLVVAIIVIVNVCNDCRHKTNAKAVHERAVRAVQEVEEAEREYKRTNASGERLQELEKIFILRGFTEQEKKEAKELLDYMEKQADKQNYDEGKRLFIRLRKGWGLE